jgi:hypothetical protein
MRRLILLAALAAVALTTWSCIEEIGPKTNSAPRIWFTRAPDDSNVIYENGAQFEWVAVDTDDDLGMGRTYVKLTPSLIDTIEVYPPELQQGWVRIYKPATAEFWGYDISNLPDTMYTFSVKVVDGRGKEGVVSRDFFVRFDNMIPLVDSVACPPAKPTNPNFTWTYIIYAHDVAFNASSATPVDLLAYYYRFSGPGGVEPVETTDYKGENKTFTVTIDGQTFPGEYKFRAKVVDMAGNYSLDYNCKFTVGETGPK